MPDPDTWPATLAWIVNRIRERLTRHDQRLETAILLRDLSQERGYPVYIPQPNEFRQRGGTDDDALNTGELEYLTYSAIQHLIHLGEIESVEGGGPLQFADQLIGALRWPPVNNLRIDRFYRATPFRVARANTTLPEGAIRWQHVERLVHEAIEAHRRNLAVGATVVARVAVEEAVRAALEDVGERYDERANAWERENLLFDRVLTTTRGFTPLDRNATRATLSEIRNAGNNAAHQGVADDAHLTELLLTMLPRALQSLSQAVLSFRERLTS